MNRLNDITGRGAAGFPVSTEIIEVLHDYRTFIEAILNGLRLSARSCILLKYEEESNPNRINNIIAFVIDQNRQGRLIKINNVTGYTAADLFNRNVNKGIQIVETPHNVSGEGEQTWEDVYYTVSANLVDTSGPGRYSFHTLGSWIDTKTGFDEAIALGDAPPHLMSILISGASLVFEAIRRNTLTTDINIRLSAPAGTSSITIPIGGNWGFTELEFPCSVSTMVKPAKCKITNTTSTNRIVITFDGETPSVSDVYICAKVPL
jgi:hypothetical protein